MTTEPKTCITCKHFKWANENSVFYPLFRGDGMCTQIKKFDLVYGTTITQVISCHLERTYGECGRIGKNHEEK